MPHLFCFGLGYSAQVLVEKLAPSGWEISGTNREGEAVPGCAKVWRFDGTSPIPLDAFDGVSHLLTSIPPDERGDPVLRCNEEELVRHAAGLAWIGYLSTTGVYGDRGGEWVDENSPPIPSTDRGRRRL